MSGRYRVFVGAIILSLSSMLLAEVKDDSKKTVTELTVRGVQSISAGEMDAALESLLDAHSVGKKAKMTDNELRDVQHYIAIVYMKLGAFYKAAPYLQRSIATKPSGLLEVTNLAVYDLRMQREILRSVWNVKDYMAGQKEVDEPTLMLLGACMDVAVDTQHVSGNATRFNDAVQFYVTAQRKLELTRKDGMRLWGGTWISAKQMSEIDGTKQRIQNDINNKIADQKYHARNLSEYQANAEREKARAFENMHPIMTTSWDDDIERESQEIDNLNKEINGLKRQIPHPSFPREMPVMLPGKNKKTSPPVAAVPETTNKPDSKPVSKPPVASKPEPVKPVEEIKPAPVTDNQSSDELVSRSFAAFAVGPEDLVAPFEVAASQSITIDGLPSTGAVPSIGKSDKELGLCVIHVPKAHFNCSPIAAADYSGELECVGFPVPSIFMPVSESIKGRSVKPTANGWFVSMQTHPRLKGSPLVDAAHNIVGMVSCSRDDQAGKLPAITATKLTSFLADLQLKPGKAATPDVYQVTILYKPDPDASKPAADQ